MRKPLTYIGSMAGSYIGWYLGAQVGLTTAFMAAVVGLGAGMYFSGRIAQRLVE